MRLFKNITTVLFLLFVAYAIYSGWTVREIVALAVFGFALDVLFNMFMPELKPEPDNE